MWEFLSNMPPAWSFSTIILLIAAIVIIALRGRIRAIFGDKDIEIGPTSSESHPPKSSEVLNNKKDYPTTALPVHRRSCGDCILLIMGEREKFEIQIKQESNRILKNQMNFTEQKLVEIQNVMMRSFVEAIHKYSMKTTDSVDESIQYKLVYGLFRDALLSVKDEIRRSFKDNGFYEMSSSEFMSFIKNRVIIIHSIMDQYVRNIFPDHAGVINPQDIINAFEKEKEFLSVVLSDVYTNARDTKIEAQNRIKVIMEDFKKWIDEFIHPSTKGMKND